jgi:hypothetical protein
VRQGSPGSPAGRCRGLGGALKGAKLPKPTLDGTTAMYAGVAAGVGVRVQVRPRGFEQDFVIRDRAAADAVAAGGGSFQIPLKTKGLTAKPTSNGGVEFLDNKGKRVSYILPAFAWDASIDARSGEPARVPVRLAVMQANPGNATLTITPDPVWLADSARTFRVTIDPTYASVASWTAGDTWAATNYPTSDMSADPELKVGTYDGGTTVARSFVLFPISPFRGVDVVKADLSLWNTYSFSCTAKPLYAFNSGWLGAATRWGNQPPVYEQVGQASAAKGFSSSCPGGRFTIPVTDKVKAWAATGNTYFAFRSPRPSPTRMGGGGSPRVRGRRGRMCRSRTTASRTWRRPRAWVVPRTGRSRSRCRARGWCSSSRSRTSRGSTRARRMPTAARSR